MLASPESLFPIVNFTLAWLPWKIRKHLVGGKGQMFGDLLVHGGREAFLEYARTLGYGGKWIRDEPDLDQDSTELVRNLGAIFLEMKKQQAAVIPAYLPAPTWASILDSEWSAARAAIEIDDAPAFEKFLRNFFRNGGISGLWGDRRMFDIFANESPWSGIQRLSLFIRQFETWRREVPTGSIDDLDEPRVGNPWGYEMDGRLIVEPSLEYHAQAQRIRDLVADVEHPVVLEIGGGFGGLARQIFRQIPGVRYIGLDLPENVVIQSWYLKRSRPDLRIAINQPEEANNLDHGNFDAAILPNWELPKLQLNRLNVVVNVRSFGEMNQSTLQAYFSEIVRLRPDWIFHENLGSPRRDNVYGTSDYPPLLGYRSILSCESRWPRYNHRSQYPCRENLLCLNKNSNLSGQV
jgi:hypothetical protein